MKKCLIASPLLLILFSVLLMGANCIPTNLMRGNLVDSTAILQKEGLYPRVLGGDDSWEVDNFTNALMLDTAGHGDNLGIEGAFAAYYYYGNSEMDHIERLAESVDILADGDSSEWASYARYWNGYLVLLKPLLVVFDINEIRLLVFAIVSLLIVFVACALSKSVSILTSLCFACPFFLLAYPVACFSLSFSPCFIIALVACALIVLDKRKTLSRYAGGFFFFMIGAVTVYFDFFCNPILTLGVPLALQVFLSRDAFHGRGLLGTLGYALSCCLFWLLGYSVLWCGKWALSSLVLDVDVVADAVNQLFYRSGMAQVGDQVATPLSSLARNVSLFASWGSLLVMLASVVLLFAVVLASRRRGRPFIEWGSVASLLFVALLPYCWYVLIVNHSYIHSFFTYRNQIVTLLCFAFVGLISYVALWEVRKDGMISMRDANRDGT